MDNDKVDREYISGLTNDELMALLPERAAWFFKKHPPLFDVHRLRLMGELERAQKGTTSYFLSMPPDQQYMIVMEIAELTPLLVSVIYSSKQMQHMLTMSKQQEARRFDAYGINMHLSKQDYEMVRHALADQGVALLVAQSGLEDFLGEDPENKQFIQQYEMVVQQRNLNQKTQDSLDAQLKRIYPSFVRG